MQNSIVEQLSYDIICIDTGLFRPRLACCYLMRQGAELAVIETGTRHTLPRILQAIEDIGLRPEQVKFVIVTHVHLDHAGGAGVLMQALPNATLVVHERGARHMIDPGKLQAGTAAVYGETVYQRIYGDLVPVAEERVLIANDGDTLDLNGRQLLFLDTPGHARHHFCVYDESSAGIFSGDTLGLVYRELTAGGSNLVIPSSTPVQFDPEALRNSVAKIMALEPVRAFLTHYSMVESLPMHTQDLLRGVAQYEVIANAHRDDDPSVRENAIGEALLDYTLSELKNRGMALSEAQSRELLQVDMQLNAQGLNVWLDQMEATA